VHLRDYYSRGSVEGFLYATKRFYGYPGIRVLRRSAMARQDLCAGRAASRGMRTCSPIDDPFHALSSGPNRRWPTLTRFDACSALALLRLRPLTFTRTRSGDAYIHRRPSISQSPLPSSQPTEGQSQ
jgi:hypothetical protein